MDSDTPGRETARGPRGSQPSGAGHGDARASPATSAELTDLASGGGGGGGGGGEGGTQPVDEGVGARFIPMRTTSTTRVLGPGQEEGSALHALAGPTAT